MDRRKAVLIIAEMPSSVLELTGAARSFGETVVLLTHQEHLAMNADRAYVLKEYEHHTAIEYLPPILELITENEVSLILTDTTKDSRLLAACIAAHYGNSVLTDSIELSVQSGFLTSKRLIYGGAAEKTEQGKGSVITVCVSNGTFEASTPCSAGEVILLEPVQTGVILKNREKKEKKAVKLGTAKYVVSVGRGIGSFENIALAKNLADAIGAELACSRPVAEDKEWMERERYVGVSGNIIAPDVYIAVGISGQVQHMTGVTKARKIIAVNRDESAPIFEKCDFGIVGDAQKVISKLTQRFMDQQGS